jgi:hypothetical protein
MGLRQDGAGEVYQDLIGLATNHGLMCLYRKNGLDFRVVQDIYFHHSFFSPLVNY